MTKKKEGPVSAGTENTAQVKEPISIVPRNLTNNQRVELVRKAFPGKYPGFHKQEASKGRNTAITGLRYAEEIEDLIKASESPRIERRRKPYKHTWRCTGAELGALQWAKNQYRVTTTQEILDIAFHLLIDHLTSKRGGIENV